MKRFAIAFLALFAATTLFAQSDLQVLAVVKLNKNDSITVKQLKTRAKGLYLFECKKRFISGGTYCIGLHHHS